MPLNQSKPNSSATSKLPRQLPDVRKDELPVFPEFDSMPAAAGLNNVEAFRLSLRHALTLLPLLSKKQLATWDPADEPERFSLT
jgi:hypothetical protein